MRAFSGFFKGHSWQINDIGLSVTPDMVRGRAHYLCNCPYQSRTLIALNTDGRPCLSRIQSILNLSDLLETVYLNRRKATANLTKDMYGNYIFAFFLAVHVQVLIIAA